MSDTRWRELCLLKDGEMEGGLLASSHILAESRPEGPGRIYPALGNPGLSAKERTGYYPLNVHSVTKLIRNKLIVALDVDSADRALDLFEVLRDVVGMFKIGSQLFTAAGPDVVRRIVAKGGRVFLDLKYHDIPNTVAAAGMEATRLGVSIFNLHASGGAEMMKRAAAAVDEVAAREGLVRPKLIAVTLLTSIDENTLIKIGIHNQPQSVVQSWAQMAADCGLDGVVASPLEIDVIRQAVSKPDFLIVTPGIRSGNADDDQRRVLTAAEAIRAGADYLVVGRPILNATDPKAAAREIVQEIHSALPELV